MHMKYFCFCFSLTSEKSKNFGHFMHELTSYSTWQCHLKLVLIIRYFFNDLICIYDLIVCFYSCIVIIISP